MVRWVVFDYGEVISRRTAALPGIAAMLDADPEAFEAAYFAERKAYDWGCPDLDYWRSVGARLGRQVDADLSERLTSADVEGWLETDPGSRRLLDDLHEQGVALALLSNAPASFGRAVERTDWARLFKHLVFSGDLKLAKPDARIYRALLETLAAEPADCLFFDDRQENVDAAREAGLGAELWSGAEAARSLLQTHLTR
ncbi:putative hydrolase of the HAD superfamily [Saccharopolyspora kobensis]|uniref:Hydrolase of the HAD superfamily n=1 Tax=Saccharopolyspora kobensis TaxID=146035 RepID=A0A1H6E1L6_9PSEU|nr:HAD family phosphatase [Saccharopolyspora kobensis]SEG91281.1 putative hydrolase of the HAD superfamily [Saccharopolyspora kobensis]SFF14617.1 putative hydrolase of the HAD superfamily [Saccharopolyspora kobensis]